MHGDGGGGQLLGAGGGCGSSDGGCVCLGGHSVCGGSSVVGSSCSDGIGRGGVSRHMRGSIGGSMGGGGGGSPWQVSERKVRLSLRAQAVVHRHAYLSSREGPGHLITLRKLLTMLCEVPGVLQLPELLQPSRTVGHQRHPAAYVVIVFEVDGVRAVGVSHAVVPRLLATATGDVKEGEEHEGGGSRAAGQAAGWGSGSGGSGSSSGDGRGSSPGGSSRGGDDQDSGG